MDRYDNEPTLGEIMRVLKRVEALAERTNGRVDRAETTMAVLTERVDTFKDDMNHVGNRANGGLVGGAVAVLGVLADFVWRVVSK